MGSSGGLWFEFDGDVGIWRGLTDAALAGRMQDRIDAIVPGELEAFLAANLPDTDDERTLEQARNNLTKALTGHARKSGDTPRIRGALSLLPSLPGVETPLAALDDDPILLGVADGVLDLRAMRLLEPNPDRLVTKQTTAAFDPTATCPKWLAHLERFIPDPAVRDWVWRLLGTALEGHNPGVLAVLDGSGRNGKSTVVDVIRAVLGAYATSGFEEALIHGKRVGAPAPEIVTMQGQRFVTFSETAAERRLRTDVLKKLLSDGELAARDLFEKGRDAQSFRFQATLTLDTNLPPAVEDVTEGAARRLFIVPMHEQIDLDAPEREQRYFKKIVKEEADGVLPWLIEGMLMARERPLHTGVPRVMQAAKPRWLEAGNPVAQFIAQCCVVGEAQRHLAADLHRRFNDWLADWDPATKPWSATKLGQTLEHMGYPSTPLRVQDADLTGVPPSARPDRGDKKRFRVGLRVLPQPEWDTWQLVPFTAARPTIEAAS